MQYEHTEHMHAASHLLPHRFVLWVTIQPVCRSLHPCYIGKLMSFFVTTTHLQQLIKTECPRAQRKAFQILPLGQRFFHSFFIISMHHLFLATQSRNLERWAGVSMDCIWSMRPLSDAR